MNDFSVCNSMMRRRRRSRRRRLVCEAENEVKWGLIFCSSIRLSTVWLPRALKCYIFLRARAFKVRRYEREREMELNALSPVYTSEFDQREFAERREFCGLSSWSLCRSANLRQIGIFLFVANLLSGAIFSLKAHKLRYRWSKKSRRSANLRRQNLLVYTGLNVTLLVVKASLKAAVPYILIIEHLDLIKCFSKSWRNKYFESHTSDTPASS